MIFFVSIRIRWRWLSRHLRRSTVHWLDIWYQSVVSDGVCAAPEITCPIIEWRLQGDGCPIIEWRLPRCCRGAMMGPVRNSHSLGVAYRPGRLTCRHFGVRGADWSFSASPRRDWSIGASVLWDHGWDLYPKTCWLVRHWARLGAKVSRRRSLERLWKSTSILNE